LKIDEGRLVIEDEEKVDSKQLAKRKNIRLIDKSSIFST